jgi:predicted transcriptional regulator
MSKSSVNATRAKKILAVAAMKGDVKEIKVGGRSKYAVTDKGIKLTEEYTPFKNFSDRLEDAFKKPVIK